jgi:ABC-2 type transport system permease protein
MVPAIVVPVFFYFINIGALEKVAERGTGVSDFRAFQVPVAIIFAVTGISRASALVLDIQGGYFDRLLMTPIRRLALLLGLMVADFAVVLGLTIPVIGLGLALGVHFETGFPYAIALKTGTTIAGTMNSGSRGTARSARPAIDRQSRRNPAGRAATGRAGAATVMPRSPHCAHRRGGARQ